MLVVPPLFTDNSHCLPYRVHYITNFCYSIPLRYNGRNRHSLLISVRCAAQRGIHNQLSMRFSPSSNSLYIPLTATCSYLCLSL